MFLTKQLRLVLQSTIIVAGLAACVGATILYAGVNEVGAAMIYYCLWFVFNPCFVVWW